MMDISRCLEFENEMSFRNPRMRKQSVYMDDNVILSYPDLSASVMACDCTGSYAALGGAKMLSIVSLNRSQVLKSYPIKNIKKEIVAIQWSPHSSSNSNFLVANSSNVDLWDNEKDGTIGTLASHSRNISDIDWSPTQENLIATCALDTFTFVWDTREFRKPIKSLQTVVSAYCVKWSKLTEGILATSHEGDLRIWDIRKSTTPIHFITAHKQKITCLDWSPVNDKYLLTCSQDIVLKFWDVTRPKQETDVIKYDILKAKYLPLGEGIATGFNSPTTRGDKNIYLWNFDSVSNSMITKQPVDILNGHTSIVIDFCLKRNDRGEHQLASWSRDQTLRLWKIQNSSKQKSRKPNQLPEMPLVSGVEMSVSPICRSISMTHVNPTPSTLEQEFCLLNKSLPNVQIEEMNVEDRQLVVNAANDQNCILLSISFPDGYPHKIAPIFALLPGSTIQGIMADKLMKDLEDTANQHVGHSRSCIEPCLRRLAYHITDGQTQEFMHEYNYLNQNYCECLEENIPFPRISGARFCGPGYLVCFTRRTYVAKPLHEISRKKLASECEVTPRAMSALLDIKASTLRSSASTQRTSVGIARSLPNDSNVPSVFEYYQIKDQKPNALKSTQRYIKIPSSMRKANLGPVIIYDLSCLLPVQKQLGESYLFDNDLTAMCRNNIKVAIDHQRHDLAQLWSLAEIQVEELKNSIRSSDFDKNAPWFVHPFAKTLIKMWFNHYELVKDVQTLAMMCCLFTSPMMKNPHAHIFSSSLNPILKPLNELQIQISIESDEMECDLDLSKRPRSNSCSEIFSDALDPVSSNCLQHHNDILQSLFDADIESKHDLFIRSYSNMLFQWGLYYKRAQLLKFQNNPPSTTVSLSQSTKLNLRKEFLIKKCCLCRLPVFGLSTCCLSCGHGGHADHLSTWFDTHNDCPAPACSCSCLSLNNYNS